jgi:hypothetical protein
MNTCKPATTYDNTTWLERVLLSVFAALFVSFGLLLLINQIDKSFVWTFRIQRVLYPFTFVFFSQMLNYLIAKHNSSVCLEGLVVKLSDNKEPPYLIVVLMLNMILGATSSFLYGNYPYPLFGIVSVICLLITLVYEEYCRSRRFKRVLSVLDINDVKIERRRRRCFVCVSYKNGWIALPYARRAGELAKAIQSKRIDSQ